MSSDGREGNISEKIVTKIDSAFRALLNASKTNEYASLSTLAVMLIAAGSTQLISYDQTSIPNDEEYVPIGALIIANTSAHSPQNYNVQWQLRSGSQTLMVFNGTNVKVNNTILVTQAVFGQDVNPILANDLSLLAGNSLTGQAGYKEVVGMPSMVMRNTDQVTFALVSSATIVVISGYVIFRRRRRVLPLSSYT